MFFVFRNHPHTSEATPFLLLSEISASGGPVKLLEAGSRVTENEIATAIVDAAVEVHRTLGGPGLLESVYEQALAEELRLRGLTVERQREVPVQYKGRELGTGFRVDLIVERRVIVECKAVDQYNDLFEAQLLTYLRLLNLKLGLVINFGDKLVKRGIRRVVNGL